MRPNPSCRSQDLLATLFSSSTPKALTFASWATTNPADMNYLLELGYTPADVFGMGSGAYRLQPFLATYQGTTQAGIAFNFDQSLGKDSPLGVFGRFGYSGDTISNQTGVQGIASMGLAWQNPIGKWEPKNDIARFGYYIAKAAPSTNTDIHQQDEQGFELTYSVQLTPTIVLQPDIQFILNPEANTDPVLTVFQFVLTANW